MIPQTWNAYRNQYWPAQYIVDQNGKIVFQHDGEGQYDADRPHRRAAVERQQLRRPDPRTARVQSSHRRGNSAPRLDAISVSPIASFSKGSHLANLRRVVPMFEGWDAVVLARAQFAFTMSFHIVFPAFSIGLASYLAVLEALWLWTGREVFINLSTTG